MQDRSIQVFGTRWCADCRRAKLVLDAHQVPYRWIDVEQDADAMEYIIKVNNGMRSVPTIVFPDGTILVEPSNRELSRKLEALQECVSCA